MQLSDLKLDNTGSYMVDIHGKKYPIKQQRGRYYINHATGQLTVTPLIKSNIFEPGTEADYVLNGWFLTYDYETYLSFTQAEMAWVN